MSIKTDAAFLLNHMSNGKYTPKDTIQGGWCIAFEDNSSIGNRYESTRSVAAYNKGELSEGRKSLSIEEACNALASFRRPYSSFMLGMWIREVIANAYTGIYVGPNLISAIHQMAEDVRTGGEIARQSYFDFYDAYDTDRDAGTLLSDDFEYTSNRREGWNRST